MTTARQTPGTDTLRLARLAPDALNPAQRAVYDAIVSGPRGRVSDLFQPWLRSPQLADLAQRLGAFARFGTVLPPRLSELAILVVARHWRAGYEWAVHAEAARRAGLAESIIADIATGGDAAPGAPEEHAVAAFAVSALRHGAVTQAAYDAALATLGERGVVELVGILGYYCLVSLTLNIFRVAPPPDAALPFTPADRTGDARD